jgi:uncharacterized membrane protein YeaQ/YmgE (transglycosylase-associated protein family)
MEYENLLCIGIIGSLCAGALYFNVTDNAIVSLGIGAIAGYLTKSLTDASSTA